MGHNQQTLPDCFRTLRKKLNLLTIIPIVERQSRLNITQINLQFLFCTTKGQIKIWKLQKDVQKSYFEQFFVFVAVTTMSIDLVLMLVLIPLSLFITCPRFVTFWLGIPLLFTLAFVAKTMVFLVQYNCCHGNWSVSVGFFSRWACNGMSRGKENSYVMQSYLLVLACSCGGLQRPF